MMNTEMSNSANGRTSRLQPSESAGCFSWVQPSEGAGCFSWIEKGNNTAQRPSVSISLEDIESLLS